MEKKYLEIGKVVALHGIKGELKVNPWSDSPDFLLNFEEFYLDKSGLDRLKIKNIRINKNVVIIMFHDINSAEKAQTYKNKILYADRDYINLPNNTFFIQDLIGLSVVDVDTNKEYGIIEDVTQTGANDIYHIKDKDKTLLIPAIKKVVIKTDIQKKIMLIKPLKGLFDNED